MRYVMEGVGESVFVGGDDGGGRDGPGDADFRIVVSDAEFGFAAVGVVDFVGEDGAGAQDGESVQKVPGDEELAPILFAEFDGDVLAEGGRAAANVDGDVQHGALQHAHEFGLAVLAQLAVEPADDAVGGLGLVVLHEDGVDAVAGEFGGVVAFEEVAARIVEEPGLCDDDAGDGGGDEFHG